MNKKEIKLQLEALTKRVTRLEEKEYGSHFPKPNNGITAEALTTQTMQESKLLQMVVRLHGHGMSFGRMIQIINSYWKRIDPVGAPNIAIPPVKPKAPPIRTIKEGSKPLKDK